MKTPIEVLSLYPDHGGTLHGLLASRARRDPQRPFLMFQDRTWSWGEFASAAEQAARMLASRGIGKGDRLGLMAPNSDLSVLLFFGLARLGAVLVPVNPEFGVGEAGYVLTHAEVAAVACTPKTLSVARRACEGMPKPPWFMLIEGQAEGVPTLHNLQDTASPMPPPEDLSPDDICLIMYTSGTTGLPKGVMHSQRNVVLAGEGFVERMYLQPEDRLLCVLPLFHINALFYSLGGTVAAGASIVEIGRAHV